MPQYVEQTKQYTHERDCCEICQWYAKHVFMSHDSNWSRWLLVNCCWFIGWYSSQSSDLSRGMNIGIRYHYGIGAQSKNIFPVLLLSLGATPFPVGTIHWRSLTPSIRPILTHWGRVTHICVCKLTFISSDNGLSPGRRQALRNKIQWNFNGNS